MVKSSVMCAALLLALWGVSAEKPGRETIVYVAAHPDDLGGSIGTMIRLSEKYDVHVVDYTRGERGLGEKGYRDGTTAKTRMAEEQEVCRRIGVTLHWCDEIDGEAVAGRATVERLASLYRTLKPRALFVHWPVDTHMDHVMSTAAANGKTVKKDFRISPDFSSALEITVA